MNKELSRFTHHILRFVYFALSFNMSQDENKVLYYLAVLP